MENVNTFVEQMDEKLLAYAKLDFNCRYKNDLIMDLLEGGGIGASTDMHELAIKQAYKTLSKERKFPEWFKWLSIAKYTPEYLAVCPEEFIESVRTIEPDESSALYINGLISFVAVCDQYAKYNGSAWYGEISKLNIHGSLYFFYAYYLAKNMDKLAVDSNSGKSGINAKYYGTARFLDWTKYRSEIEESIVAFVQVINTLKEVLTVHLNNPIVAFTLLELNRKHAGFVCGKNELSSYYCQFVGFDEESFAVFSEGQAKRTVSSQR
ncbi:MAG TPA: hypothetical protein VM577_01645 [Anaerovoracaceae bacterium]|nr:hypothetical protein [Anaerovoracaceae bacterium]